MTYANTNPINSTTYVDTPNGIIHYYSDYKPIRKGSKIICVNNLAPWSWEDESEHESFLKFNKIYIVVRIRYRKVYVQAEEIPQDLNNPIIGFAVSRFRKVTRPPATPKIKKVIVYTDKQIRNKLKLLTALFNEPGV